MRVLILAAGDGTRWGNHLGVPKHLIPIKEEPLIHRTQRMLRKLKVRDVRVVCRNPGYAIPNYVIETPRQIDRRIVHPHEESRHLWNEDGKTVILYGDMYYSVKLLSQIIADSASEWKIYARHGASKYTGKDHGEIFAWVFLPKHHAELDAARNIAIAYVENGVWHRCIGWEAYRVGVRELPWDHCKEFVHMVDYDDESDDFDYPEDWDRWSSLNPDLAF